MALFDDDDDPTPPVVNRNANDSDDEEENAMSANVGADLQDTIGVATSTMGLRQAASNLHDGYRKKKCLLPFGQSSSAEFEEDNCKAYFLEMIDYLGNNPVPQNCNEDLLPKNPNNKKCISPKTMEKYIGQIKEQFKRRYPNHPEFRGRDPDWWKQLMKSFMKAAERMRLRLQGNDDIVFGEQDAQPLYRCNFNTGEGRHAPGSWYNDDAAAPLFGGASNNIISTVDLNFICRKLMKKADVTGTKKHLQERAWVCLIRHCAGRAGEIRFNDLSDWKYHYYLQAVDITWTELKTCEKYSMPMVSDLMSFLVCPFHAIASAALVERLFFRSSLHESSGCVARLFPDCHNYSETYVAKNVTRVIRDCLKEWPKKSHEIFSSKSLRAGAITELSMHPDSNIFFVNNRSGHSTRTNLEYYVDKKSPLRSLASARALSGRKDSKKAIILPRLEWLGDGNKEAVHKFLCAAFVVSVPYLQPGGHIFEVTKHLLATLILWHNDVQSENGMDDAVASRLREVARNSKITDCNNTELFPEMCLMKWSTIMKDKYMEMNEASPDASGDMASLAAAVNHLTCQATAMKNSLNGVVDLVKSREEKIESLFLRMASHNEMEMRSMKDTMAVHNLKLSHIKTPDRSTSYSVVRRTLKSPPEEQPASIRRKLLAGPDETPATASVSVVPGTNSTISTNSAVASLPSNHKEKETPNISCLSNNGQAVQNVQQRLVFGGEAKLMAEKNNNKGITVSVILRNLHENNFLSHCSMEDPIHQLPDLNSKVFHDKGCCKNCMELVDYVITTEEKKILISHHTVTDNITKEKLYSDLQRRILKKMDEFEGNDDMIVSKNGKKKAPGPTKSGAYMGLGQRVRRYKKYIRTMAANSNLPSFNNENNLNGASSKDMPVALCERTQIPQAGTPEGNHSVRKYFSKKLSTEQNESVDP